MQVWMSVTLFLNRVLLSENIKIEVYRAINFCLLFCMDLKLKCLTLRVEHRLRVFQNRVLMKIFGSERDKVTGALCDMYSLQTVFWVTNSRRNKWARNVAYVQQMCTVFWWRNLRERDHS